MDCETVGVDSDFDFCIPESASVDVTFLSPRDGFVAGLDGEEGEEAAVIGFDDGFEVGGFALFYLGAELVHVPRGLVLVIGYAMGGFAFVEVENPSG